MQTMSTAMATLLKSGKMIGANKPTHEVIIGDSIDELIDPTDWSVLRTITSDGRGRGCVGETVDGRAIAIYAHGDSIKVGFASSILALTSGSEVINVANEIIIDTGYNVPVASVALIDGKLIAVIGDYGGPLQRPRYWCWRDDTGMGDSFIYQSEIWYPAGAWMDSTSAYDDCQLSPPTKLLDGNIAVFMPVPRDSIISNVGGGCSVTTNYGNSWSNTGNFTLGIGSHLCANQSGTIVPIEGSRFFTNHLATSSEQVYPEWNFTDGVSTVIAFNELSSAADGTYSYAMTLCRVGDIIYRVSSSSGAVLSYTTELEPSVLKTSNSYWTTITSFSTNTWTTRRRLLNLSNALVFTDYNSSYMRIMGTEKKDKIIQSKSITINRSKGMAGGLTLELDNKSAILAPDGTANPQLLWPNKEVIVKQGYGQELLKTFTGLIDSISMSRDSQGVASVTVSARDKLKVALDHLIRNQDFLYTLTYTNMLVEDIWKNLVGLAGLTYNTVEATGLTISSKTFSWETYADAFSWLDEISGFETYCDEEGKLNFVWDGRPSTVTTAYSFIEGVDITRLGYEINDQDLFYTVAVYGKLPADPEVEGSTDSVIYFAKQLPQATYWNIPSGKVLRIDAPDADTQVKCEIIADKAIYLMQTRARQVTFSTIGIPHLQRGDFIQVTESSSTISEIYRITDISTQQGPDGYSMTLTCYYHAAPEVI